ncbi:MAG: ComF family protein [Bacteroidales bacterium]
MQNLIRLAVSRLIKPVNDLFNLVFPFHCEYCGQTLKQGENVLCSFCEYQLPLTHFHFHYNNPVEAIFWGRVFIESAASFLYYQKGEMVQHLIHQLKYHNKGHTGIYLGGLFGEHLLQSRRFSGAEVIIPVPLHWKKERFRGYNQSDKIAHGLAESMRLVKDTGSLRRRAHSVSQTHKARYDRWKNVHNIFELSDSASWLEGRHILLVDDVITTGATIEACANKLYEIKNVRLSVVSLACPNI